MSLDFSGAAGELFSALASRVAVGASVVESEAISKGEDEREPARIAPGQTREGPGVGKRIAKIKEVASSSLARKRNPFSRA